MYTGIAILAREMKLIMSNERENVTKQRILYKHIA